MQFLQASHIHKTYRKRHILRGINITLDSGDLMGIVGENGAGKSTLMKILAGELKADKGKVHINGSVGYCPQQPIVNKSLTVWEHLDYFKSAYRLPDMSYTEYLLDALQFGHYRNYRVETLSGGTLQKLNLTLTLMQQPDILLLDEPYQGFDWYTYKHFWHLIEELKRSGKAIVIISHLIFEHKKFDGIMELSKGHIEIEEEQ